MKKRITSSVLWGVGLLLSSGSLMGQDLYINTGGSVSIAAGDALYSMGNTTVAASGSLTILSDASTSGSFIAAGSVTGSVSYHRYISDTDWHLVSAPVSGQSIPLFVAESGNSVTTNGVNGNYAVARYKSENSASTRWTYHNTSPSAANQETLVDFNTGQGYSMNRTAAGVYMFSGSMETANVAVSLTYSGGQGHYWSCVGNPYPSFMPANANASASNVLGQNLAFLDPSFAALYLWDGSGYQVINQASAAVQLAPGQAFMVKAKDASETFTFTESLQNHQSGNDNFYRNTDPTPRILLQVSDATTSKETEIKYLSNATTGLDVGYDAGAYVDGSPSFSLDTHLVADSQGVNFTLQCLPDNDYENIIVPLSITADAGTELTFGAVVDHLPQGIDVYLNDAHNGSFTNITNINQGYTITLESALAGIGRFYIYTSSQALSTDNPEVLQTIKMYQTDHNTVRITGLQAQQTASIQLYDITGKTLMSKYFSTALLTDVSLPGSLKTGVYIVRLQTQRGALSKKIIIE